MNGRWLMYRSRANRSLSSIPRSITPGGTAGVPTAPSRIASNVRSSVERGVGQDLAVTQVAVAAEVELDRVEACARGVEDLERLGRHLRPDAVAADHGDAMSTIRRRARAGHGRSGYGHDVRHRHDRTLAARHTGAGVHLSQPPRARDPVEHAARRTDRVA